MDLPPGELTPAAVVEILRANPLMICMMESICRAQDLKEIPSHMKNINVLSQLYPRLLDGKLLEKDETSGSLQALDPK